MARRLVLVLIVGLVLAAPAAGDNSGKIRTTNVLGPVMTDWK